MKPTATILWAYAAWDYERDDMVRIAYAFANPMSPFDAVIQSFDRIEDEEVFLRGMEEMRKTIGGSGVQPLVSGGANMLPRPIRVAGPAASTTYSNLIGFNPVLSQCIDDVALDTDALQQWAVLFGASPLPVAKLADDATVTDVLAQGMLRARAVQTMLGQRALYPRAKV